MDTRRTRKKNRLSDYDYSRNGVYFVTICTKDRTPFFWKTDVGAIIDRPSLNAALTREGKIVAKSISEIPRHYPDITVDNAVIMPNHVHLLLTIRREDGRSVSAPTNLSTVIRHMKGFASREIGFSLWQRSYYDRVIRDEREYRAISRYITENPQNWKTDCFYGPS